MIQRLPAPVELDHRGDVSDRARRQAPPAARDRPLPSAWSGEPMASNRWRASRATPCPCSLPRRQACAAPPACARAPRPPCASPRGLRQAQARSGSLHRGSRRSRCGDAPHPRCDAPPRRVSHRYRVCLEECRRPGAVLCVGQHGAQRRYHGHPNRRIGFACPSHSESTEIRASARGRHANLRRGIGGKQRRQFVGIGRQQGNTVDTSCRVGMLMQWGAEQAVGDHGSKVRR